MSDTLSFSGQSNKWNTAQDAADVVAKINAHTDLKILDLENNTLGPDAAKVIGDALAGHPEFERARFKDLFTGRLKTEIPLALKHLFSGINRAGAKIVELDLSDNALGPVGVEGMVDFMCSSSCYTLQELRLNNNGLGITGGKMLAESLNKLVDNSNRDGNPWQLKVFIAGRNRLEKVGAKVYANLFKRLGSLEELAMPQNGIFHEGIAALAEAMAQNPNIRVLNLNDNTFTKKGAVAMAKYLPAMTNLEVINFGDCLLKDSGASCIARAIMGEHHNLKEICVDGNELSAVGGLSIAEAIQNKPQFEKLMMDDNMFGDDGKEMIETLLEDAGVLHTLEPMENNCDPDSDEEEEEEEGKEDTEESEEEDNDSVKECSSSRRSSIEVVLVEEIKQQMKIEESQLIKGPIEPQKCQPSDYLLSPTPECLLGLTAVEELLSEVTKSHTVTHQKIDNLLRVMLQSAYMAHTDVENLSKRVSELVRLFGAEIFRLATENQLISFTTNAILAHLSLIKSEDKKKTCDWSDAGVQESLVTLLSQDYFPNDSKNTLAYFITKRIDSIPEERRQDMLSALKTD